MFQHIGRVFAALALICPNTTISIFVCARGTCNVFQSYRRQAMIQYQPQTSSFLIMFGPRKMVVFPRVSIFPETKSSKEKQTSKQTNHVYNIVTLVPRRLRPSWITRENPALEGCNATLLPLRDTEQQQRTCCI